MLKINKTDDSKLKETDEAFLQTDELLTKVFKIYDVGISADEKMDKITSVYNEINVAGVTLNKDFQRFVDDKILTPISEDTNTHTSEHNFDKRMTMVRGEIGKKSFYNLEFNAEEMKLMNTFFEQVKKLNETLDRLMDAIVVVKK